MLLVKWNLNDGSIYLYYKKVKNSFIHFMIINIIVKMHCKRLFQIQDLHGVFTACTRRAHKAPMAL